MIRVLVHGGRGRMGARICTLAADDPRFDVVCAAPPDLVPEPRALDLVIDFSSPAGAAQAARIAVEHGAALLVGTTGLSAQNLLQLDDVARSLAVLVAPNTAPGVAVLCHLVAEAARKLGDGFSIEIAETHHVAKRDAPSGTALRLAEALRVGAERSIDASDIRSIREGEVIGEHEIVLSGPGERLRLSHSATTRDLFASGALRAGAWLTAQSPGRYTIEHALGLA